MNCYLCASPGTTRPAVAICNSYIVAVCMEHLAEREGYRLCGAEYGYLHVLPKPPGHEEG